MSFLFRNDNTGESLDFDLSTEVMGELLWLFPQEIRDNLLEGEEESSALLSRSRLPVPDRKRCLFNSPPETEVNEDWSRFDVTGSSKDRKEDCGVFRNDIDAAPEIENFKI